MANIVPTHMRRDHAVKLRRLMRRTEEQDTAREGKVFLKGESVEIGVSTSFDEIFIQMESDDGQVMCVPIDRAKLKQLKSDFEWMWSVCRNPGKWRNPGETQLASRHSSMTGQRKQ